MSSLVIEGGEDEPPLPGLIYPADPAADAGVLFVFAHGAGAGQASPFMRRYASLLAERGIAVVTFDFPYVAARRKMPDRAPVLERAFLAAMSAAVAAVPSPATAVVVGGKSMGGRMATHLAAEPERWTGRVPLVGAVAFGYPLRPPGPRGGDRVSHLQRLRVPTLVVQGTRDTFGGPDDVRAAVPDAPGLRVLPVETGDHSLKVLASAGRPQAEVERDVAGQVARWMVEVAAFVPPRLETAR
jgi:predicted alpha/beta-hydrolase family hydrolase